jgi:hypothetical protein
MAANHITKTQHGGVYFVTFSGICSGTPHGKKVIPRSVSPTSGRVGDIGFSK